jgi:hypothetical protein
MEDEASGAASAAPAFSPYPPEDTMSTPRWLLPFTYGIDLHAIASVMSLAEAAGATLVTVALIGQPTRPGKREIRLEDIQQATDFLEAVNNQTTRLGVPVEGHEVVTCDVVQSLTTLIAELGCEAIVLVSRKGEEIFLEAHQLVQRFMTVDNSDVSPNRLRALKTRLILASQRAHHAPISNSEDEYGPSSVRVLARGLPPPLSGAALAS